MTNIGDNRKYIFDNSSATSEGFGGMINIRNLNSHQNLQSSFNIVSFKAKFNVFLDALSIHLKYEVDEVFKYYRMQETLSKTLLVIIIQALWFLKGKTHYLTKEVNGAQVPITDDEIETFRRNLWNNNRDNTVQITYPSSADPVFVKFRDSSGELFGLYNYLVQIENDNHSDIYLSRIKTLSNEVNKYFFLTEILLKMLLDTKHNVITTATDNKEIVRNFSDYRRPELGMHKPNEDDIPGWAKNQNECRNGLNPTYISNTMKNKLLKNIYDTITRINIGANNIRQNANDLDANNINDKEMDIINLKNDKNIEVNKITTLLNKKKEINNNNKRSLVKTIALFIVLLILIGGNIYTSIKNNPNKLLQINIGIILIIFIMKFYYLFK
jgi:hypothetical protein